MAATSSPSPTACTLPLCTSSSCISAGTLFQIVTFSAARIGDDVKALASDAFAGRGPGEVGEAQTLAFLAARFQAAVRAVFEELRGSLAALEQALQDLPWHARARQWVDAADAEEEQSFDDLARVVARMWIDHLGAESRELAAAARTPEDLQRLRHLNERIAVLKAGLAPAGPAKPG
jgi:hypothetical protein